MTEARRATLFAPGQLFSESGRHGFEVSGYDVVAAGIDDQTPDLDGTIESVLSDSALGDIDLLIVGDGIFPARDDPDANLHIGLRSTFVACRTVIRGMMKRRFGRIVAVTPSISRSSLPHAAVVGGLAGLMKSVAREVGSRGITANVIATGHFSEPSGGLSPYVATGRVAAFPDVVAALRFVAADDAGYITGQVIALDGGLGTQ